MFEILRTKDGKYYWRLKAFNGEILCHSETYESKQSAIKGINSVRTIAFYAPMIDRSMFSYIF